MMLINNPIMKNSGTIFFMISKKGRKMTLIMPNKRDIVEV